MSLKDRREEQKLERRLQSYFGRMELPVIDENRKQKALELLRLQRKSLRIRTQKPFIKRAADQAAYLSPGAWICQGVLLVSLLFFLGTTSMEASDMLISLAVCAPVLGLIGFTEVLRSFHSNIWELEQACRYNLRQIMLMRLLIFGTADFGVLLAVLICGTGSGLAAGQIILFFLIPQILSDCVYLYLTARLQRRFQSVSLAAAAIALAALWMYGGMWITRLSQWSRALSDPAVLALVLAGSLLLLACCVKKFLHEIDKGGNEKWNFSWIA